MNIEYLKDIPFLFMIGIFFFSFLLNTLFAKFTLYVVSLQPINAATTGMLITLLNAVGIIACTTNYLYFGPLLLGSWLGNFAVVYHKKRSLLIQTIKKGE